ncbi:hypothetical protein [Actinomadura rudentiformis]|uniref:Uncharacterized protein n=1 Tax=Actinomadura rudentiformis TaxID=359158 RepID=A0A6H9YGM3_9ACTN|nr:hypothetical protein [Actinomadura rudentiformis]KAB2344834.1 hypothetical protein F8566_30040 [Actinomadura rudentiformis]
MNHHHDSHHAARGRQRHAHPDSSRQSDHEDDQVDGLRACAAGNRCAAHNGHGPARTPRPFCEVDRARIESGLRALITYHHDLQQALGERRSGPIGGRISGTTVPGVPIRLDLADLAHQIRETLLSWEERVRDVAGLPDAPARTVRPRVIMSRTVRILTRHLDVLLALPPAAMTRPRPDGEDGWDYPDLDGTDAGLEIHALVRRCRSALGLTHASQILAAPCRYCGLALLERLDSPAGLADDATCTGCGHHYSPDEYDALVTHALHETTHGADL